jgi:hypothetical protein
MTYTNTLTLQQITDMMTSISNSLYQISKNTTNIRHKDMVKRLYYDAVELDHHIGYTILAIKPTSQEGAK